MSDWKEVVWNSVMTFPRLRIWQMIRERSPVELPLLPSEVAA